MKKTHHWIMGSAIGLAGIAVAIDHTRHTLPEPVESATEFSLDSAPAGTPCGLDASPCGLGGGNPCSLDSSPCSM